MFIKKEGFKPETKTYFTSMIAKNKPWPLIIALVVTSVGNLCAQPGNSSTPFLNYYYDYKLANPGFAGTQGKHVINAVYSGIPFGSSKVGYRVLYGSYERNIASIKTGVGGVFMHNKLGASSSFHYGLLYRKQLSFNKTSGLHLGTHVFYQSRKIDYSSYRFIEPVDELLIDGNEKKRSINVDLGLLYYSSLATVGVSVKNIAAQKEENTILNLIATKEFGIMEGLKVNPSVYFLTDFSDNSFRINNTFEIKKWILLGTGYRFAQGGQRDNLTFNVGLNIKDWVQIITHVYSSGQYRTRYYSDPLVETLIRVKIPERDTGEVK